MLFISGGRDGRGNVAVVVWIEGDGDGLPLAQSGSNPGFDPMVWGNERPWVRIPWDWAVALKLWCCFCSLISGGRARRANVAVAVWIEWDGDGLLVAPSGSNPGYDRMGWGNESPWGWIPWDWAGALKLLCCCCGFI